MAERIKGSKVDISYADVQRFFADRSANDALKSKYNYVLFQDDHPELAVERDRAEKEKLAPVLGGATNVLDIGCGIGRWGEFFVERGIKYTGIDAGAQMIERARENLADGGDKVRLYVGLAQDTMAILHANNAAEKYDAILVNGVFMYLNDADLAQALAAIGELAADNAVLYLKESMGLEERLTLSEIHSAALGQDYSAIYRSIAEYGELFKDAFGADFTLCEQAPLFADNMRNRKETIDYYFIWRHK